MSIIPAVASYIRTNRDTIKSDIDVRSFDVQSFESPTNIEKISLIAVTITNNEKSKTVKTIDISMLINVIELSLSSQSRLLVKGIEQCTKLIMLTIDGVRFDRLFSQSLKTLVITNWYNDAFVYTIFPNLKHVIVHPCTRYNAIFMASIFCNPSITSLEIERAFYIDRITSNVNLAMLNELVIHSCNMEILDRNITTSQQQLTALTRLRINFDGNFVLINSYNNVESLDLQKSAYAHFCRQAH